MLNVFASFLPLLLGYLKVSQASIDWSFFTISSLSTLVSQKYYVDTLWELDFLCSGVFAYSTVFVYVGAHWMCWSNWNTSYAYHFYLDQIYKFWIQIHGVFFGGVPFLNDYIWFFSHWLIFIITQEIKFKKLCLLFYEFLNNKKLHKINLFKIMFLLK